MRTTEENNILIAEWLGETIIYRDGKATLGKYEKHYIPRYDLHWDYIMDIKEKLEKTGLGFYIIPSKVEVWTMMAKEPMDRVGIEYIGANKTPTQSVTTKDALYKVCVYVIRKSKAE